MNIKNNTLKMATVAAVVFSFIACEDDFETVGSNIIGGPGFNAELYDDAEIEAYTFRPEAVQTNNLPLYLLGVYNDPLFGVQEASLLTSLDLSTPDPDFGMEPVLDSVVLSIPYFSREVPIEEGGTEYKLDSIYGSGPIELSVIESKFFLNTLDPDTDFQQAQKYYSNMEPRILSNQGTVLYENNNFIPSAESFTEYLPGTGGETDTVSRAPALRVHLNKQFFQSKILDEQGSSGLLNSGNFRDYFRGVYFKANQAGENGSMMLLNFQQANTGITLYYKTRIPDTQNANEDDEDEFVEVRRSYTLGFGSSKVNIFDQDVPVLNDDENLILKGGEGSIAVIELFAGPDTDDDGVSDELENLRENNWLVNEANIVFHVNRDYVTGLREPERVFLYDLDNNNILADYVLDNPGQRNSLTSLSNNRHLVPLTRNEDGEGISYKVRITRHINEILNNEADNVRLGLAVSQNVNLISTSAVLPQEEGAVTAVPSASIITPLGTVLYGPDAQDEEKRLKLNIYYTEPKN